MLETWTLVLLVALATLCPLAASCNKKGSFATAAAVTVLFTAILLFPAWWPAL